MVCFECRWLAPMTPGTFLTVAAASEARIAPRVGNPHRPSRSDRAASVSFSQQLAGALGHRSTLRTQPPQLMGPAALPNKPYTDHLAARTLSAQPRRLRQNRAPVRPR